MKKVALRRNQVVVAFDRNIFKLKSNRFLSKSGSKYNNQDEYYPNYLYDNNIYPNSYPYIYINNIIYQQPNLAVQPYHIYNFFSGSDSTYQESKFEDNCSNLGDDLNLNVFNG
jgi:hypothetical protein